MSDFYNKYPYTDFHELNIDWIIERVKQLTADWLETRQAWENTEADWQELYDYVHDYFNNLDVQEEINNKINAMISDGTFQQIATPIIQAKVATDLPGVVSQQIGGAVSDQIGSAVASQISPVVASQITAPTIAATEAWLSQHITQPTTPVVDTTLNISGAAADSKITGDATVRSFITSGIRALMTLNKIINGITFLLEDSSGDHRFATIQLLHNTHDIILSCSDEYQFNVEYFNSLEWTTANHINNTGFISGNYTIPSGSYFAVQFRRVGSIAFDSADDKFLLSIDEFVDYGLYNDTTAAIEAQLAVNPMTKFRTSQTINKGVDGITHLLVDRTGDNLITNVDILYTDTDITLIPPAGYAAVIFYYSTNTWATENFIYASGWQSSEYIIPKDSYYVVQFRKDSGTFTDESDKYLLDVIMQNVLLHILVTGQSLAVGAEGNPALTTQTPMEYIGKCYEFNGGARPTDGQPNDTGAELIPVMDNMLQNFSSLCEQDHSWVIRDSYGERIATVGETICSAAGYWFNKLTKMNCLVSNHGVGGFSYSQLKKGTLPYTNSIRAVRHAKELCERYNWRYVVYGIAVVHGEADMSGGATAAQYKARLEEWISDYNADIKAITGQSRDIQMFVSQSAASSAYNLEYAKVADGVFEAAEDNAKIHLVCPQYCYPITYASVHMNNRGYRVLGEFFGNAMGRKYLARTNLVLYPIKSTYSGTSITLECTENITLSYDGANVAAVSDGHWGFELVDAGSVEITNVGLLDNKIIISLNNNLPAGAQISYAYKTLPGEMGYIGSQRGVRGNIRATTGFTSIFTGEYYPNWLAMFCIPVNWTIANTP